MWWAGGADLQLYLARDGVCIAARSWPAPIWTPVSWPVGADSEAFAAALPDPGPMAPGTLPRKCQVWLSSYWARATTLPQISGAKSEAEATAADALTAAQRAGWAWPCEVRPLDPPGSRHAMRRVFAVPAHVLQGLSLWSRSTKLTLSAISPSWQVVLDNPQTHDPSVRAVMLADRDGVTSITEASDRTGSSTTVGALSEVALARLAERTRAEHGWDAQALRCAAWMRTPAEPAGGRVAQAHGWSPLGAVEWWG